MQKRSLAIIGSGGHASVVFEAAKSMDLYESSIIIDRTLVGMGLIVNDLYSNRDKYKDSHDFFVAIGDNKARETFINQLAKEGFVFAKIIHSTSIIAENVNIGLCTCVLAGAVINPNVTVGTGSIINTGSRIDHDDKIGDFTHICPGVILAGNVTIGNNCFLGVGSIVSNKVSISNNIILGAGCVVIKSLFDEGTYVGVPARKL